MHKTLSKALAFFLCLSMILTGCTPIGTPDAIISETPTGKITVDPQPVVVKNKLEPTSGEVGSFYAISATDVSNIYTADTSLFIDKTEMWAIKFVPVEEGKELADYAKDCVAQDALVPVELPKNPAVDEDASLEPKDVKESTASPKNKDAEGKEPKKDFIIKDTGGKGTTLKAEGDDKGEPVTPTDDKDGDKGEPVKPVKPAEPIKPAESNKDKPVKPFADDTTKEPKQETIGIDQPTEALFTYELTLEDKTKATGYVGVSQVNPETVWVMYGWVSEGSPAGYAEMYEKAFKDTFSQRVFAEQEVEEEPTTPPETNPNLNSRFMYVPIGSSGFDIIFKNSTEIVKTSKGYDVHLDPTRTLSIENFKVGHADINISEAQLGYEDLQMTLIKDAQTLEHLVKVSELSSYKELEDGFWKSVDYNYMIKSRKMYARVYVIGLDYGFTTVVMKSSEPFSDTYFKEDVFILSSLDRKTKAEYSSIPAGKPIASFPADYSEILQLNPKAISLIRTIGGRYLAETFGDATYSQGYLSKQIYFKDNYANVLLPITGAMDVDGGAQDFVSCTNAVYGNNPASDYNQAKLEYRVFEVTTEKDKDATTDKDKPTPPITDTILHQFTGAVEFALTEINGEIADNNYKFSVNKVSAPGIIWQGEFAYRAIDRQLNKAYTKRVFCYIKDLGYNCYMSALLTYSDRASSSTVTQFQTAYESSVKASV
ncbi:MAG: hypothetical protein RSC43_00255 [Clostridia bacterium]